MVNWSPSLGTAVSDLEVDYVEEQGTRTLIASECV
jgi:valyl-tRNA synthetase